jgi:capsular polysaccharide biosynthesis protein
LRIRWTKADRLLAQRPLRVTNAPAGALTSDFEGSRKPMPGSRSPVQHPEDAELRLELTSAEVRQVWALYSRPGRKGSQPARPVRVATETPLAVFLREVRPLASRWRRTLALTSVAAMALGVIFLWVATPTFGVRALVLVEQRGPGVNVGVAPRDASAFLAGQAEILGGASLVKEALIRSKLGSSDELSERDALAQVLHAFSAAPVFGTEVIALELHTQDPAGGVRFVQAVIDSYEMFARSLESGENGVAVRTLAAPTRQASPLWPRPAPVLFSCLVLGLLAGLGLGALAERAERAERAEAPEADWSEIREAAWAG